MQMMILSTLIIATLLCPGATLAQNSPQNNVKTDSSGYIITTIIAEEYPEKGKIALDGILKNDLDKNRAVDWIVYTSLSCNSEWDQTCEGTQVVEAPPNWQACKALFSVSSSDRGAKYSVVPTNWYTNDQESPDRYRAYSFYLYAKGSGIIFDRWGSNVNLSNVGLRIIPAAETNSGRYLAGCEMPRHD